MNTKKLIHLIFCIFFFVSWANCQDENISPPQFDQYFKNSYLINPAILDTIGKVNLSFGNRTYTGLLKGVARNFIQGSFKFHSLKSKNLHDVGVLVIAGKDGEFFSKNRAFLRYGYRLAITSKIAASAGVSLGFINYSVKSSPASAGGNSTVPDIHLGIWITSSHIDFGISSQQLLQLTISPLDQTFILARIYDLNLNYKSNLNKSLQFNLYNHIRYQNKNSWMIESGPILIWKNILEGGFNYRYLRGMAIIAGVSSIKIASSELRITGSFFISSSSLSGVNDNILEFSIAYIHL